MNQEEIINTIILTRLSYFHLNAMVELYRKVGSATDIIAHRGEWVHSLQGMPARLAADLADAETMRPRAEEELAYCQSHDIRTICLADKNYPRRLAQCPDAPLMLFYKGTADLNARHIINIVGTRHCTVYGEDMVRQLVTGLHEQCPDTLIVSGLAYGVDIQAHRNALANGMETLAVLAHGLDDLYPPRHRDTANQMIKHGGLLTEYMTRTKIDKLNFVRRNRITAGLCDACVVVESARKGGGLITARIAREYNRDVFAFPGAVGATYSEGCNNLIRDNGAALITSADDLVNALGWQHDNSVQAALKKGIDRELFPQLSDGEKAIAQLLASTNDLQANIIAMRTSASIADTQAALFNMEMKGVVKAYAGGFYHLLT